MRDRKKHRSGPVLEALETRALLAGGGAFARQWAAFGGAPVPASFTRNAAPPVAPEAAGRGAAGAYAARFNESRSAPRSFNLVAQNDRRFQPTLTKLRSIDRVRTTGLVSKQTWQRVGKVRFTPPVASRPSPLTPSPAPPAPPTSSPANPSATAQEIVDRVNQERRDQGLAPLAVSAQLTEAAAIQAGQMVSLNRMEHTLPEARYPGLVDRINAVGYRYSSAGENIAYGYPDASSVMNGWMNSSGHRANILSTGFTEIGVAVAHTPQGVAYYAQVFGRPSAG